MRKVSGRVVREFLFNHKGTGAHGDKLRRLAATLGANLRAPARQCRSDIALPASFGARPKPGTALRLATTRAIIPAWLSILLAGVRTCGM